MSKVYPFSKPWRGLLWLVGLLLVLSACTEAAPSSGPAPTTAQAALSPTSVSVAATATASISLAAQSPVSVSAVTLAPTSPTALPPTSSVAPLSTSPPSNPTGSPAPTSTNSALPQPPSPSPSLRPNSPPLNPAPRLVAPAGCCQEFRFAADGRLVYYDKPADDSRTGSWAFEPSNGQRRFLTAGFGTFSPDLTLAALPNRATLSTALIDLASGRTLATLPNRAGLTLFSPDKRQVAYLQRSAQQDGAEAPQRFELGLANTDGSQRRVIWNGRELASLAWFPDGRRLLLTGRDADNRRFGLWVVGTDGSASLVVESKGLNNAALSPDGQWLAWVVTLQGPERSGVWLGRADGSGARKLDWVGGFRWAGAATLFYLPGRGPGETAQSLWQLDPTSGQTTRLTDPTRQPLRVALDQWQIAPDARSLVYRNAADNALWQIILKG